MVIMVLDTSFSRCLLKFKLLNDDALKGKSKAHLLIKFFKKTKKQNRNNNTNT